MDIARRERLGIPFYCCDGFSGTAHGFSTRLGGVSPAPLDSLNLGSACGDAPENVAENFRRFCAAIGADSSALVKNKQVHSDLVRLVTAADILSDPSAPGVFEADGLITDVPGVCLAVFSADCIPVLLYDPDKQVIAAAHAGWRGTALGVAHRAAVRMQSDYGCSPASIRAAIGPGISRCCFVTHADVPDGLRAGLGEQAEDFIFPIPGGEQYKVDLKGANALWLRRAGLLEEHIAVSSACTCCCGRDFWSHRKLGLRRGSMAALIQLLPSTGA